MGEQSGVIAKQGKSQFARLGLKQLRLQGAGMAFGLGRLQVFLLKAGLRHGLSQAGKRNCLAQKGELKKVQLGQGEQGAWRQHPANIFSLCVKAGPCTTGFCCSRRGRQAVTSGVMPCPCPLF